MWHETRMSATEVLAEERLLLRLHSLRRNLARAATTDALKRERKPVFEACGATFLGEQWPEKPAAQPCRTERWLVKPPADAARACGANFPAVTGT